MPDQLTESQISELKEAFLSLDRHCQELISIRHLSEEMSKNLHRPVRPRDLWDLIGEEPNENGLINFEQYLKIMKPQIIGKYDAEEAMLEAFKFWDKDDKGYIVGSDFRHELTHNGIELTDEELDEMSELSDFHMEGRIFYEKVIKMLHAKEEEEPKPEPVVISRKKKEKIVFKKCPPQ